MDIRENCIQAIKQITGFEDNDLQVNKPFDCLNSIDLFEIVLVVERLNECEITDFTVGNVDSFENLIDLLVDKCNNAKATT